MVLHLIRHFFDAHLPVGLDQPVVMVRTCVDSNSLQCLVINCSWIHIWTNSKDNNGLMYLCHLVNNHGMPLLRHENGDTVKSLADNAQPTIVPHLTEDTNNLEYNNKEACSEPNQQASNGSKLFVMFKRQTFQAKPQQLSKMTKTM